MSKFAKGTERSLGGIGAGLQGGLDGLTAGLTAGLGPAGDGIKTRLDAIGTSALASGSALKFGVGAGAVAAGLALTKFATDGSAALLTLTDEVRTFQRTSGASAEDSSRFVAVLDDLQISTEAGAGAMFKLGREVAAGAPKLRQFGIDVERSADGSANLTETLLNVADAYSRAPDQASKTAIAFGAFGKQAQSLLPLLELGRRGLADFFAEAEGHGQLFTQEDLDQAKELRLALDEVSDSMRGLQLIGAKALVPFITTVADAAAKTFTFLEGVERRTGGLLSSVVKGAGDAALRATGPIGEGLADLRRFTAGEKETKDEAAAAAPVLDAFGQTFTRVSAAAVGGAGAIAGWGDRASRVAEQIKAIAESQDARREATLSVVDADLANRSASLSFADALERVAEAERGVAGARVDRLDATRAALTAERALNAVEDAKTGVVDAERELDRARAGRGQRARQLADAEKGLREAQEAVASAKGVNALRKAQEGLGEAEQRVADARADGGREEDVRRATEALADAQRDARQAALDLAEAREEASRREVVAQEDVTAARNAAASAAVAQAKAEQALVEAQAKQAGRVLSVSESYGVFRERLIAIKDALPAASSVRGELERIIDTVGELPAPPPIDVTFAADTGALDLALAAARGKAETTTREVRILGASAFVPFGTSAEEAGRRIVGINLAVGDVRAAVRDPLRLSADVAPVNAALDGLRERIDSLRADTGNLLAGLTMPDVPALGAPTSARRTAAAPAATSTTIINNNNETTVQALGANADVAREIDARQAKAAARAR